MFDDDYSIGLDIGTGSVGFAATKDNGDVVKFKGREIIGVRLFSSANTAAERRVYRSTRRRIVRRKNRIKLLRDLLRKDILEVDKDFYKRLDTSFLHVEDKEIFLEDNKNILFHDFGDKDFHNRFKTIYHLRDHLMTSNKKEDIRLIYLAIHHILKYRGHFLYEGEFSLEGGQLSDILDNLFLQIENSLEYDLSHISDSNKKEILWILQDKKIKRSDKQKNILAFFKEKDAERKAQLNAIFKGILGLKTNFEKLFPLEDKFECTISNEEKYQELSSILGDNNLSLLETMKELYSAVILKDILGDSNTISGGMISIYENHKKDLAILKKLYRQYAPSKYNEFFKSKDGKITSGSYAEYISKGSSTENLYKKIKSHLQLDKLLKSDEISEDTLEILNDISIKIEDNIYLKKQRTSDNISIPYQLHKNELIAILEAQSEFHPILKDVKDKIISIHTFRIPYYVGPLNKNPKEKQIFGWMEKQKDEKIYPWNFKEVVDTDKAGEDFIERMRNKCTYLLSENTLPKNSIILQRFNLLNELNNVKLIDTKENILPIDPNLKLELINNLFSKEKKVTLKRFKNFLKEEKGLIVQKVTGTQKEKEFASTLSTYIDFKKLFQCDTLSSSQIEMIETIVTWLTIFNDKSILKRRITNSFGNVLDKATIDSILKKKYKGWGRLSNRLINGQRFNIKTLDPINPLSILDIMEQTNNNFMKIINDKSYGIDLFISTFSNKKDKKNITLSDIRDLPGSPAIKKSIWQSIKIIDEISSFLDREPKNIYLEFAREEGVKKRTKSRKKKLEEIFKGIKNDDEVKVLLNELSGLNDDKLKGKKLFLYFIQQGRCMYSGEALSIDNLKSYHIDHIIPQALVKDDSIENTVLVKDKLNTLKSDESLSKSIISSRYYVWENLKDNGLIGAKKFFNLTRGNLNENVKLGFIARQLVETRQITKHLTNLLVNFYKEANKNTKVYTIRADLVTNLRKKENLYKIRALNNNHHAVDAYLTCIIGNFIETRYPKFQDIFEYDKYKKTSFIKENLQGGNFGFIINSFSKDKNDSWDYKSVSKKLKGVYNKRKILISYKLEEEKGSFYNENASSSLVCRSAKKPKSPIAKSIYIDGVKTPVNLNPVKYGGFSSIKYQYLLAVKFEEVLSKKNKECLKIVGIPKYLGKPSDEKIIDFLIQSNELSKKKVENIKILKKLPIGQIVHLENGQEVGLVSGEEVKNTTPLYLSYNQKKGLSKILSSSQKVPLDEILDLYYILLDKLKNNFPLYYLDSEKLFIKRDVIYSLKFSENELIEQLKIIIEKIMEITGGRSFDLSKNELLLAANKSKLSRIGRLDSKIKDKLLASTFINRSVTGIYEKKFTF